MPSMQCKEQTKAGINKIFELPHNSNNFKQAVGPGVCCKALINLKNG